MNDQDIEPQGLLVELLSHQLVLQEVFMGCDVRALDPETRASYIRDCTLALTDELHEALQETGWKPWASDRQTNGPAFRGELVDALHFLLNLFLATCGDMTPQQLADDIIERYYVKAAVNAQRQADGYDGMSSKCPACRRELTDAGVVNAGDDSGTQRYACGGCGKVLPVNHPMALIQ